MYQQLCLIFENKPQVTFQYISHVVPPVYAKQNGMKKLTFKDCLAVAMPNRVSESVATIWYSGCIFPFLMFLPLTQYPTRGP